MILVSAAQLEFEAAIKSMEAATLRNDAQSAIDARQKAHDILDVILDLKAASMTEVLKSGDAS
jgi:hypothetical protein